ncbi:FG-GAP repeat protein [Pseudoalteromonas sp. SMS1]|uniref:FG-GAP repeat protein n=1 Tax=Pseudoalteromonas sp. SMS1 TaxID=2908894 RepID=UPI001F33F6B2|nr:FG-GAP repeat protein [Pseudoalteromonas sp. SMS1]MCF2859493.1 FG-GAP repeat protein [Pseudoalteromonas sp. SMS1]
MKLRSTYGLFCAITFVAMSHCHASTQKLLPNDGKADDQFAFSVAIDGTTALIGAHKTDAQQIKDSGAAYIFSLKPNGWQQQAKLVANPAYANDTVGGNVALRNQFAMLGVIKRDDKGKDAGAVVAFKHHGESWSQTQIITAHDAKAGDAFGQSIALTERFLVIGAPHSDSPHRDSGSAYVFERNKDTWQFKTKLSANDGAEGDLFGISVAIDNNTILVGADLHDEIAEQAGAVYAYVFDGKQWHQQAKLVAKDGADTDIFGVRVALVGDTALISARRDDIEGVGIDAGSAYVFERSNGKWSQAQKLLAPDGQADDRFARGVALTEDTALISAMHHDANGQNAGALYVFKKHLGQWHYTSKIVAPDGSPEDRFGWNIAVSDQTAIVATPHRDDNGSGSGAAYILDLSVPNAQRVAQGNSATSTPLNRQY